MNKSDLSNYFASEMDRIMSSDEHKQVFSNSAMLEKLAFNRVSDQDKITSEIEIEMLATAKEDEKCCECASKEAKKGECSCECHPKESKKEAAVKQTSAVEKLVSVSEELETQGFERLASMALKFAGLIVEAKAKGSDKKAPKKDKKDSKKSEKSKSSKSKGKDEKSKSKEKSRSSKKSAEYAARMKLGQNAFPEQQHLDHQGAPKREAEVILAALQPAVRSQIAQLEVSPPAVGTTEHLVKVRFKGPANDMVFNSILTTVKNLQMSNSLPGASYKVIEA